MPTHHWNNPDDLYFITGTLIKWLNIFTNQEYAQIILDSFTWNRKMKNFLLFSYVIMPSHIHAIIKPLNENISRTIQSFASFTAHEIVKKLSENNRAGILKIMEQEKRDQRSNYSVWQSFHSENIFSERILNQKMEYIHSNPVRKIEDSDERTNFIYSSASFYDLDKTGSIEIDDVRDYLLNNSENAK
jgi:REP element-mobilizing transposase RayT